MGLFYQIDYFYGKHLKEHYYITVPKTEWKKEKEIKIIKLLQLTIGAYAFSLAPIFLYL